MRLEYYSEAYLLYSLVQRSGYNPDSLLALLEYILTLIPGVRAEGQAGFRPDHRTVDNVFIMQQMLEHYQSKSDKTQRKLYACFVDFKKAFDTVDRCVLWQVLWMAGIRGRILGCIKAMYACDSATVHIKTKNLRDFSVLYRGQTRLRTQP